MPLRLVKEGLQRPQARIDACLGFGVRLLDVRSGAGLRSTHLLVNREGGKQPTYDCQATDPDGRTSAGQPDHHRPPRHAPQPF
jgi:hypothetical protein